MNTAGHETNYAFDEMNIDIYHTQANIHTLWRITHTHIQGTQIICVRLSYISKGLHAVVSTYVPRLLVARQVVAVCVRGVLRVHLHLGPRLVHLLHDVVLRLELRDETADLLVQNHLRTSSQHMCDRDKAIRKRLDSDEQINKQTN